MTDQFGTPNAAPEVTSDDRLWAALAYVFPVIVPIILLLLEEKKNRPFIKAHNVQALIWGGLIWITSGVTFFLIGALGIILWAIGLFWAYKAYKGEYVNIPIITDFCKKQGWA